MEGRLSPRRGDPNGELNRRKLDLEEKVIAINKRWQESFVGKREIDYGKYPVLFKIGHIVGQNLDGRNAPAAGIGGFSESRFNLSEQVSRATTLDEIQELEKVANDLEGQMNSIEEELDQKKAA